MLQAFRLGLQREPPGGRERVVAALAAAFGVRLTRLDEALGQGPLEQRVEGASGEPDVAARELLGAAHDRVAVERPVDQRREGEIAGTAEFHAADDRSMIDMSSSDTCRPW